MQALYDLGALKVLSVEASRQLRGGNPETRVAEPIGQNTGALGCRRREGEVSLCRVGLDGPGGASCSTSANAHLGCMAAVLQWIARKKLDGYGSDLTNAFGQALRDRIASPAGILPTISRPYMGPAVALLDRRGRLSHRGAVAPCDLEGCVHPDGLRAGAHTANATTVYLGQLRNRRQRYAWRRRLG